MTKSGLRVLITGAAAGIGEACARRLAADGARVAVADVSERRQLVAREIDGIALHLDVADDDAFRAGVDDAVAQLGGLDALINNAGITSPASAVQDTSGAEFDRLIAVNLRGTFNGCRFAHPHLCRTRGNVLNISSMAGVTGQERHAVYAATKGAINALTKSCAVDWGKSGVRCNALWPAGVWTDALRAWADVQPDPDAIDQYLNRIHALNYCPGPREIADVAAFLVSHDARFITGAIIPVSGGSECGYRL